MSRILVVEDEDVIRSELARLLARTGHDVIEARTVPEAMVAGAADGFQLTGVFAAEGVLIPLHRALQRAHGVGDLVLVAVGHIDAEFYAAA